MRASIMARCASLTRTGLDWTHKYPAIAAAVASLAAKHVGEIDHLEEAHAPAQ